MSADRLKDLQIQPEQKQRPQRPFWIIVLLVLAALIAALLFARPWSTEKQRRMASAGTLVANASSPTTSPATDPQAAQTNSPAKANDDVVLTVSGYIINRERIEISPRFLGVVN